jgi:hypothetical protein
MTFELDPLRRSYGRDTVHWGDYFKGKYGSRIRQSYGPPMIPTISLIGYGGLPFHHFHICNRTYSTTRVHRLSAKLRDVTTLHSTRHPRTSKQHDECHTKTALPTMTVCHRFHNFQPSPRLHTSTFGSRIHLSRHFALYVAEVSCHGRRMLARSHQEETVP